MTTTKTEAARWTIMVYMAADNSLYRPALRSLHQILDSEPMDKINVVVQLQGPKTRDIERHVRTQSEADFTQLSPPVAQDRKQQLEDFLTWCAHNVSADRYMLVLWGHGDGLDKIYIYKKHQARRLANRFLESTDGSHDTDSEGNLDFMLDLQQLMGLVAGVLHARDANQYVSDFQIAQILRGFRGQTGKNLDLLGFDACLMGMAEVCSELKDSVGICVASATVIPDQSWPYDAIRREFAINPGVDAEVASTSIISKYVQSYAHSAEKRPVELSSFDLSATDKLEIAMASLVQSLVTVIAEGGQARAKIAKARERTAVSGLEQDYCDLYAFCLHLRNAFLEGTENWQHVSQSASDVLNVLLFAPEIVYHEHSNVKQMKDFKGLSIYFPTKLPPVTGDWSDLGHEKTPPHSGKGEIIAYNVIWNDYIQLQFSKATHWPEFLSKFLTDVTHQQVKAASSEKEIDIMQDKTPPHSDKGLHKGKKKGGVKTPPHGGKDPAATKRKKK